jgi:hypothetical protein
MAIRQFTEPDINLFFDDLNQALILNNKASFVGRGYLNVMFANLDNALAPVLMAGSSWEQNGALFFAESETAVSGTPANNAINYVYAKNDGTLYASQAVPVWNASNNIKGGWYSGNDRAFMRLYYASNGPVWGNKVLLPDYYSFYERLINHRYVLPSSGGFLYTGPVNSWITFNAPKNSIWRIELKGGKGGKGGNTSYGIGGNGADGEEKKIYLKLEEDETFELSAGGNGGDAPNLSYYNAGAGGGGTGGTSYLYRVEKNEFFSVWGGSGGGGGAGGWSSGDDYGEIATAGGGAGGFGVAEDGIDTGAVTGVAGKGGHNGIGGDAQDITAYDNDGPAGAGGGGSGFISGGVGGKNKSAVMFLQYSGQDGGGEGEPGGGAWYNIPGGASQIQERHKNGYQGGGAGGSAVVFGARAGGAGGSGLKSVSGGYARLYRIG